MSTKALTLPVGTYPIGLNADKWPHYIVVIVLRIMDVVLITTSAGLPEFGIG